MQQESLGAILRLERLKRNMTQVQVCRNLGMNIHTLSNVENNKGKPSTRTIRKLTDFYGIDIDLQKAPLD